MAPETLQVVIVADPAQKRLKAKHPWIFSNELAQTPDVNPGELVEVRDRSGHILAIGYYNPHTLIAVRILSFHKYFDLQARIREAIGKRTATNREPVYRAIYSESDHLPGLIADRYNETLVVQILTAGMDKLKEQALHTLIEEVQPKRVLLRNDTPYRKLEGLSENNEWFYGEPVEAEWIELDGLQFLVQYEQGQKTGFFLDQRLNRKRLAEYGPAESLLDIYSYTGAWALYGAAAGIKNVIAVDSSAAALNIAAQNAARNGHSITTVVSDAPAFLREAFSDPQRYARIVLDPPAFCKSKRHLPAAIRAYREINLRAMKCLSRGGMLFTCSCSQPVTPEIFMDVLHQAARASGREFHLRELLLQPPDHPILIGFPESHYLKCAVLQEAG